MRAAIDPMRGPAIDPPRVTPAPARTHRRKVAVLVLVAVVLVVGLLVGVPWFLNAQHYESTDDAFLDGDVVHVAPQVAGRVMKVLVRDNELVSKGTLLIQIDPRDYELRVSDARAELAQAQGKLAESQAQLSVTIADADQSDAMVGVAKSSAQNAAADLARYDALSERAVSKQTHDSAAAAATGSAAQLAAAQKKAASSRAQVEFVKAQIQTQLASVQHSQAALDEALLDLSYTDVRADADGRVTRKNVEPGNYLQLGQQVMAIVPQNVWVTANFKETQLEDMRPGSPADIYVDAYPHHTFHGKVDSIQFGTGSAFSLLPPENATGNYVKVVQRVPVKITFDSEVDPNFVLAPGMSAEPEVKVR
jgi:membrane fusion protein (multidrug efflux system)